MKQLLHTRANFDRERLQKHALVRVFLELQVLSIVRPIGRKEAMADAEGLPRPPAAELQA